MYVRWLGEKPVSGLIDITQSICKSDGVLAGSCVELACARYEDINLHDHYHFPVLSLTLNKSINNTVYVFKTIREGTKICSHDLAEVSAALNHTCDRAKSVKRFTLSGDEKTRQKICLTAETKLC